MNKEAKDFNIFNNINCAIWVEDASALYSELCQIESKSGLTLEEYLVKNPDDLPRLIDLIKIIDVNDATVSLYQANDKKQMLKGIRHAFIQESYFDFAKMLINLFPNKNEFSYTSSKITKWGHKLITQVNVKIPEECTHDWSQMIITETDVHDFLKQEISLKVENEQKQIDVETRDRLLSVIAHDLKNPFNNIIGFSDLLLSKPDNFSAESKTTYLEYINKAAKESDQLLNELLHWGRLQQSSSNKKLELTSILSTVSKTIDCLKSSLIIKDIKIKNEINPEHQAFIDKDMLCFVVRNVLSNAIKFSNEGSYIHISSESTENFIKLCIADNGVGMPKEVCENLFGDKFITTPGTNNEKGNGLGLKLCSEFMYKQKGNIRIDSKEGEGTKVWLSFVK